MKLIDTVRECQLAEAIRWYHQYRKDMEALYVQKDGSYLEGLPAYEKPQFCVPGKFWLSRFFDRVRMPYYLGLVFFFYFLWELPRLAAIWLMLQGGAIWITDGLITRPFYDVYLNLQLLWLLGDLLIPICWIFLRRNHKFLRNFNKDLQSEKFETDFLMPKEIIAKEVLDEIESADKSTATTKLKKLDAKYTTSFFYGSLSKTLQAQYELILKARYQLIFGLIVAFLSIGVGWASGWFQSTWTFAIVDISNPQLASLANLDLVFSIILTGWFWFTIGIVSWTGFWTWTVCLLTSGPVVVDFDADAPLTLRKKYYPIVRLALSNAFLIALIVTWVPLARFFSEKESTQINPAIQGQNLAFLAVLIAMMLPVILLLSIWPCYYTRQGLLRSKERKEFELENEKRRLEGEKKKSSSYYKMLSERLERLTAISTWPLDIALLSNVIGLVVIPVLALLASIFLNITK